MIKISPPDHPNESTAFRGHVVRRCQRPAFDNALTCSATRQLDRERRDRARRGRPVSHGSGSVVHDHLDDGAVNVEVHTVRVLAGGVGARGWYRARANGEVVRSREVQRDQTLRWVHEQLAVAAQPEPARLV